MATYEIRVDGEVRATFKANFAQASCPILLDGEATPFQVADARHEPMEAAELLDAWCDNQGCEIIAEGEEYEVVARD